MIALVIAAIGLAAWAWMLVARDGFWLARERDDARFPAPAAWPAVVAIVPARDEADVIGRAIGALVAQDYAGAFSILLVDDGSSDGTAANRASGGGRTRSAARDRRHARRRVAGRASSGRCATGWRRQARMRLCCGSPMPTSSMHRRRCACSWRVPWRSDWCCTR